MSAIAGRVLLIPKGAYDANVTYHMLDVVSYGGNSYVAKQTTAGNTPSADNAYWMLLSAGSAVASINDIGDVLITSPTNGQVLKYNATTQKWENGQDTGGLLPHLIIISEDGESEVKAVKGSTEIIATRTSAGHYECDVPEFGTWTIHAVLNGDDATVNLVVDTVKVYTVDDSHWHADITVTFPHSLGVTCSCSKEGTTTLYATESPYTFTVHEAGTYTITTEYDGNEVSETISVSTNGEQKSMIAPAGADALPVNDINLWLFFAGIDNSESTYSSLADILADDDALIALMISNEAVDYLVRSTSWASSIVASEDAMKAIGANDYASNALTSDSTWLTAIDGSTYKDYVINVKVPVMTSATTPSGEVTASTQNTSGYDAWRAFNGVDASAGWLGTSSDNEWIQYDFGEGRQVKVVGYDFYKYDSQARTLDINHTYTLQGSDDGTNVGNIDIYNATNTQYRQKYSHLVINNNKYRFARLALQQGSSSQSLNSATGWHFQFYGRENGGVQTWLHAGGITDKNYTTLAEVLADSTTLSALMASQSAVDYLVTCKGWASTICANQIAMTYIGLNNYCADTLLDDNDWMTAICNSTYFESVLNDKIPFMTGETTPSGQCFWSGNARSGTKWGVFSEAGGDWSSGSNSNEGYLGYMFDHMIRPYLITSTIRGSWSTGSVTYTYSYQSSADGTNYNDITPSQTESLHYNYPQSRQHITNNHSSINYFRFHKNAGVSDCPVLNHLQLYGRVDV